MLLTGIVIVAAVSAVAPDLPVFADATLDEAVRRGWPSGSMILVVDNGETTAEEWDHSPWSEPSLVEHLRERRVRVVYANSQEQRAVAWMLDLDRTPAAILYLGGEERARRYGARHGEAAATELIEWFEAVRGGSSPADRLRERIAKDPTNAALRWALIRVLNISGELLEEYTEIVWFLKNPDHWAGMKAGSRTEADARAGLLWIIASLREKLGYSGVYADDSGQGPRQRDTAEIWAYIERIDALPTDDDDRFRLERHLNRLALEVRDALRARIADGSASGLDRFVLDALGASSDEFQNIADGVTEETRQQSE